MATNDSPMPILSIKSKFTGVPNVVGYRCRKCGGVTHDDDCPCHSENMKKEIIHSLIKEVK